jgi:RNA polymerase sigma-70 factor (ECF subfamily)
VYAPNDEELLRRLLDGDATAFRTLVERYHRELFHFALRYTNSKAVADDIVQEAFLQLHLSAPSFDPQRRLKPWLFTITANKARDQFRSRSRRREVPLDAQVGGEEDAGQRFLNLIADEAAEPDLNLQTSEQQEIVRNVIEQMPPHLAEILLLGYYHALPYKDIAGILGIPLGTVKSRLHAAVTQFGQRYRDSRPETDETETPEPEVG